MDTKPHTHQIGLHRGQMLHADGTRTEAVEIVYGDQRAMFEFPHDQYMALGHHDAKDEVELAIKEELLAQVLTVKHAHDEATRAEAVLQEIIRGVKLEHDTMGGRRPEPGKIVVCTCGALDLSTAEGHRNDCPVYWSYRSQIDQRDYVLGTTVGMDASAMQTMAYQWGFEKANQNPFVIKEFKENVWAAS